MPEIDPRIPIETIHVRPEEKLISARLLPRSQVQSELSAQQALQVLARVGESEAIGSRGPVIAAASTAADQADSQLRLYEAVFGRDSLVVAHLVFPQFPELTRATIKYLATYQGLKDNPLSEEEPGKIPHEIRDPHDPIARSLTQTRHWQWPYYGGIDATPLFIKAIAEYTSHHPNFLQETHTTHDGQTKSIRDSLLSALAWLTRKLDENTEGVLEFQHRNPQGQNDIQSWKDSLDSHSHADGTLANTAAGIASIEVQALAYDALMQSAELLNQPSLASQAQQLKNVVLGQFWLEDEQGGYFALGSDRNQHGQLRTLNVRTSNMGHLLHSQILEGPEQRLQRIRDNLVQTLFSPSLLSSRGIRTLASHENRFRPHSYHNGSVWPWDTCWISLGLLRHGYLSQAQDLWQRIQASVAETQCFPEFMSGDDQEATLPNRVIIVEDTHYKFRHAIEQPPQQIQAWTVASLMAIEHLQKIYGRVPL